MSRHSLSWLLWAALAVTGMTSTASAQTQPQPVKPYVMFIMDVSGSMGSTVSSGPASCTGAAASRLDHAKCAVQNVANAYGDMVMGLGRFRYTSSDTDCSNGCTISGLVDCSGGQTETNGAQFQVVVPILEGNQADLVNWDDFTCGQCTTTGAEPEMLAPGSMYTPLDGSLVGDKLYWQGLNGPAAPYAANPYWAGGAYWTGPGADPIRNDPLKLVFTSPGHQCRPYLTILMTDGDETCGGNAAALPNGSAASLLTTSVDGRSYRIETKVIGFGQAPGYAPLEAIAHAGGAPDVPGVNEAYYAQNEEELELAINDILAGAIKFEQCNGVDDDCDLLIDEDFNVGATCHDSGIGRCQGTGVYVCNATGSGTDCQITVPGGTPTTEVCNGIDDNCNGLIDEGGVCNACGVEVCDGIDNDCDGVIDDGLTRPCGTDLGVCTAGIETCTGAPGGVWGACTATTGSAETCNNLDDDCDGRVDGMAEPCSSLPGGNPGIGPCHPGTDICSAGVPGVCTGEVLPQATDPCNNVDDDCDGAVDEDFVPADCSTSCGIGLTQCVNGVVTCDAHQSTTDDTCNGIDDDCDGLIDEDVPPGGACDGGGTICNGTLMCINGVPDVCVGQSIQPELCNCVDDNCNNVVDEGNLCPTDTTCVHPSSNAYDCQCAQPCASGEFPCPVGRICVDNFCLVDPCANVDCPPQNGDLYACQPQNGDGVCVRVCDGVSCPNGFVCYGPDGTCHPDDCTTFPDRCSASQHCVGGTCVDDLCANVTCNADEYCLATDGQCYGSCAGVDCPSGERCRLGACETDPCGAPCPNGQVCDDTAGDCVPNQCGTTHCPTGEACNPLNGQCEQDPCLGVTCPGADQVCVDGTCDNPPAPVDAGPDDQQHVTAAGGGGCAAGGGDAGGLALLGLLAVLLRRRARGEVQS